MRSAWKSPPRDSFLLTMAFGMALAGCGSTVQQVGLSPDPFTSGLRGADSAPATAATVPGGGTADAGGEGLRGSSGVGGPRAAPPSGESGGPENSPDLVRSAAQPRGLAQGAELKIGYLYSDDAAAVFAAAGVKYSNGDIQAQQKALQDDINRRGGILGHRVRMIGHNYSTAGYQQNPALEETKECRDFTEDRPVFAVFSAFLPTLTPCLTKHGVITVAAAGGGVATVDSTTLNQNLLFAPGYVLADDYAFAFVERLRAQGYFRGWDTLNGRPGAQAVKIGLFHSASDAATLRYFSFLRRALKGAGYPVHPADEFTGSDAGAAILKWRGDGVTHVLGLNANDGLSVFTAANSQGYRPRYALDSTLNLSFYATAAPAGALRGALGVGWLPKEDVDSGHDPGPVSSQEPRCLGIMRKAGINLSSRTVVDAVLAGCETLWSLEAALKRAGAASAAGASRGFDALGPVLPVQSFGNTWGPSRHASANVLADVGFQDTCGCFVYSGTRTKF